jgi:DNA invertase Pin-like site-specific DNA recombinase
MASGKFVAYYRVSTDKQGRSGLGLEAQQAAVREYLDGGDWELIAAFTEIETGKRNDRPQLAAAVAAARKARATLIVAKMDRLGRRAGYVLHLLESSGIRFVFTEMPHASDLEIGIRAVVAQEEGRAISVRTKAALAAAKARGTLLGKHGKVLAAQNSAEADRFALGTRATIADLRAAGITSVRRITEALNEHGVPTADGGKWHVQTVHRLLKRLDRLQATA